MGHTVIRGLGRVARRAVVRTVVATVVGTVVGASVTAGIAGPGLVAGAPVAQQSLPDVHLNVATLGKLAALKYCATTSFASDPDSVKVLYGVRQLTALSSSRTFVLRNGKGQVLLCDLFGRDRPAILPLPAPTADRPAVLFTTGQRRWSCDGSTLSSFRMTSWLKVLDPISSARVRYTVDGVPGPWFTSARQGRFIHLQSWMGPVLDDAALKVELQLLDKAGTPVTVPGIPSGPRRIDGCGGSAVIG